MSCSSISTRNGAFIPSHEWRRDFPRRLLKAEEKLESWIYQIARHRIIDYYRARTTSIALEEVSESDMRMAYSEIPEEDVRAQIIPSMMSMLLNLPEPYRQALYLTDYKGLSQKELASRLGISVSGAKSRVQRAREKLRQMLLDCCHFEFDRLGHMIDYQPRCNCCEPQAAFVQVSAKQ